MKTKSTLEVPIYLEAESKDELIAEMAKNNQAKGAWCSYMQPSQQTDGTWVTWYYWDISNDMDLGELEVSEDE